MIKDQSRNEING